MTTATRIRPNQSVKSGWFQADGKRYYMRSGWEINYAHYLNFLKKHGEIKDWSYETDEFWFEGIKRGCRSYLPDFKVINMDGSIEYHEVKGHMDQKSRTKLARMARYYPEIKVELIDSRRYRAIMKSAGLFIPKLSTCEVRDHS